MASPSPGSGKHASLNPEGNHGLVHPEPPPGPRVSLSDEHRGRVDSVIGPHFASTEIDSSSATDLSSRSPLPAGPSADDSMAPSCLVHKQALKDVTSAGPGYSRSVSIDRNQSMEHQGSILRRSISSGWSVFSPIRMRKDAWRPDADQSRWNKKVPDKHLEWASPLHGVKTPRGVMSPLGYYRNIWDYFMLLVLAYVATVSVYVNSFLLVLRPSTPWFWFERTIDVAFIIDIVLCFRTAIIVHERKLETRKDKIAVHYMKTWFVVDVIGTFPWDLLAYVISRDSPPNWVQAPRILRVVRIVKAARILRVLRHKPTITRLEVQLRVRYGYLRLFWLVIVMALIAHWSGCLFYVFGQLSGPRSESWIEQDGIPKDNFGIYIAALYFAFYTVATVGYGDITPNNSVERIYVAGMILVGALTFAFVISQVGETVHDLSSSKSEFRKQMDELADFVSTHDIPPDLTFAVRRYFLNRTTYQEMDVSQTVLDAMSPELKSNVMSRMYKDVLKASELLCQLETRKLESVYASMSSFLARPGEAIFFEEDSCDCFYAVLSGEVDVFDPDKGVVRVRPGSLFGEDGVLFNRRRRTTASTVDYCHLAKVPRDAVIAALNRDRRLLIDKQLHEAVMLWEHIIGCAEKEIRFWMIVHKLKSMALSRTHLDDKLKAASRDLRGGLETKPEDSISFAANLDNPQNCGSFKLEESEGAVLTKGRNSDQECPWGENVRFGMSSGCDGRERIDRDVLGLTELLSVDEPSAKLADARAVRAMERWELEEDYLRRGRHLLRLMAKLNESSRPPLVNQD